MMASDGPVPEIYIHPGESQLTTEPVVFRTVLGSCVAIAFLAPSGGVGAICHPMLPSRPPRSTEGGSLRTSRRYVDFAIRDLASQFDALGIDRRQMKVKVFGGADVLLTSADRKQPTIGRMNCEAALRVLREEGLQIVASSLGGNSGLKLDFNTGTGEVLVRRLG